jgi:1-acyl-sn-glycerol-3-phosphate acyltransferase
MTEGKKAPRLSALEETALALGRLVNERPVPKRMQVLFHRHFTVHWVTACLSNLLHTDGAEKLHALSPRAGVLLCANHRSFFDQYVVSAVLTTHRPAWCERLYFPVRSNFFYESWAGIGINLLVGGYAMYPPIFRDPAKAELNRAALAKLEEFLGQPGAVVGLHPEGTRGKGPDPYELLPAQPGVGQVALRAAQAHDAPIVPVFVNGLSNDFVGQILSNFRRPDKRGEPVIVVFGDPVDLGELKQGNPRPALYKRTADRILDEIRRLGERERRIRTSLT